MAFPPCPASSHARAAPEQATACSRGCPLPLRCGWLWRQNPWQPACGHYGPRARADAEGVTQRSTDPALRRMWRGCGWLAGRRVFGRAARTSGGVEAVRFLTPPPRKTARCGGGRSVGLARLPPRATGGGNRPDTVATRPRSGAPPVADWVAVVSRRATAGSRGPNAGQNGLKGGEQSRLGVAVWSSGGHGHSVVSAAADTPFHATDRTSRRGKGRFACNFDNRKKPATGRGVVGWACSR